MKDKLNAGQRVYGTAVVSPSVKWVDVVKQANLDFVFLDSEHIPMGRETLANLCTLYSANGIPSIVRIPSPDPYIACTVLDGGATAILAPYVETVNQVKQLVGAVKYRPLKGIKLQKILDEEKVVDVNLKKYIDNRCKNNMLFINVESKPAVENLSNLLAVPGLDGVIIGPHDLSCSYDLPEMYNDKDFEKIVRIIIEECKKKNLAVGIHLSEEPEQQIKWANAGVNIILHSSDISLFGKILKKEINQIRSELHDEQYANDSNSMII